MNLRMVYGYVREVVTLARFRRALQWRRMVKIAEADRARRSIAGRKAWVTRRANEARAKLFSDPYIDREEDAADVG